MLRGAISGFGEVAARAHLVGWRAVPDVQIVAVHDPVAARRHEAINLIRNVRVYDDLDLMLVGERLDFVDIASPPAYHASTARAALEADAHVLVEKPLCLKSSELVELRAIASASRRVLMCVHNWKHAPAYRRAFELIASGRLGAIEKIAMSRLRTKPAGAESAGERWRRDPGSGGGILIDHGWHVFYLMQWLLNGGRPRAVSAHLAYAPESQLDEAAQVRIEFPGASAEAQLSWRAANRSTTATIIGNVATLLVDENRLTLTGSDGITEDHSVADIEDDSYHPSWFAGVAKDFVEAVTNPGDSILQDNMAEAEIAVAAIEAARASAAQSGAMIPLTLG